MMVFKLILTGVSSFSLGLVVGILIIYFLGGRKFFSFMKMDRMNMCSEMSSNVKEVHSEVDRRATTSLRSQELLEDKGDGSDE